MTELEYVPSELSEYPHPGKATMPYLAMAYGITRKSRVWEVGKNPCPICGGHLSVIESRDGRQYTVTCTTCKSSAKSANASSAYLELVSLARKPRYIEIDGTRVEVRSCEECPCARIDGYPGIGDCCTHPESGDEGDLRGIDTDHEVAPWCPLRKVE